MNEEKNIRESIKNINEKTYCDFNDLCEIMTILRSKYGCEWDKEQTHKSIRKNLLEETYEVIETIDNEDYIHMREELGDLLLQVIFHSQIATEENKFSVNDVIDELCKKLIVRHPHVFGNVSVSSSEEVLKNWDKIKVKTKNIKSVSESMKNISKALPALMRAHKIGEKGAKIGFDFDDSLDALTKVKEEIAEVEEAIKSNEKMHLKEEIGDLLLAVVNVARLCKVDAEEALYFANDKFIDRFTGVENSAADNGINLISAKRDKKDELWENEKSKNI